VSVNASTLRGYEINHTTTILCANRTQHMWRVQWKLESALLQSASQVQSSKYRHFAGHYHLPSQISLNYTSGFSVVTSQTLWIRKWKCVWEDKTKENVLLLLREQVDMGWHTVKKNTCCNSQCEKLVATQHCQLGSKYYSTASSMHYTRYKRRRVLKFLPGTKSSVPSCRHGTLPATDRLDMDTDRELTIRFTT